MKRIKYILYFILFPIYILAHPSFASEIKISLLISDNPQSQYVAKKLQSKFFRSEESVSIEISNIKDKFYTSNNDTSLIVSVGTKSTNIIFNNDSKIPIYSLMVPRDIYNNLISTKQLKNQYSALYLDQPFERYLLLLKKLMPNAKRIGIFTNNNLSGEKSSYELIAKELDFELFIKPINTNENPINEINQLFSKVDAVLLLPEKIINQLSAKWILFSAFRNQKPVVGFSKKFLDAGALASIHSNLDDLVEEAYHDILYFLDNKKFKNNAHYPKRYEIKINESVSRTLNLSIDKNSLIIDDF